MKNKILVEYYDSGGEDESGRIKLDSTRTPNGLWDSPRLYEAC